MQFNFVNFSTTKIIHVPINRVFCVNFAADIKWEVGKAKFKFIKKIFFYYSLCRGKVGRKIPPLVFTGGIYRYFPAWQIKLKWQYWQIMANITFLPRNTGKYDFLL